MFGLYLSKFMISIVFFNLPLEAYVYTDIRQEKGVPGKFARRMRALHSVVLVTCTKDQACVLLTFSNKIVNNPTRTIWGNTKFASVIVEKLRGRLDWRFHFGFGHQFSFDAEDKKFYYCIGFTYSESCNESDKNILVFQVAGEQSSVRMYSVSQIVPASHLPRIISTIATAEISIKKMFFAAIKLLFYPGSVLPKCHAPFDKAKVTISILIILIST